MSKEQISNQINITLRQRIFVSMILLIMISFALTGAFSYYHFKQENREYHEERLQRKEEAIVEAIDYLPDPIHTP